MLLGEKLQSIAGVRHDVLWEVRPTRGRPWEIRWVADVSPSLDLLQLGYEDRSASAPHSRRKVGDALLVVLMDVDHLSRVIHFDRDLSADSDIPKHAAL